MSEASAADPEGPGQRGRPAGPEGCHASGGDEGGEGPGRGRRHRREGGPRGVQPGGRGGRGEGWRGPDRWRWRLRPEHEIALLEVHQRILEQRLADVVERLRRLHAAAQAPDGGAS